MEFQLSAVVTPLDEAGKYAAKVFVRGLYLEGGSDEECVFGAHMILVRPTDDTEARMWALHVLRSLALRLSDHVIASAAQGEVHLMYDLFEHKEELGCRS